MHRSFSIALAVFASAGIASGADQPMISMNLNGSRMATVVKGWPAIGGITVAHSRYGEPDAGALVISAKSGTWSDAVRLEVRDAQGKLAAWPIQAIPADASTLVLDGAGAGSLVWTLRPE